MRKNTPILQLMHDTAGPTNRIKSLVALLKNDNSSIPERDKMLNLILQSAEELNKAIDTFYINSQ